MLWNNLNPFCYFHPTNSAWMHHDQLARLLTSHNEPLISVAPPNLSTSRTLISHKWEQPWACAESLTWRLASLKVGTKSLHFYLSDRIVSPTIFLLFMQQWWPTGAYFTTRPSSFQVTRTRSVEHTSALHNGCAHTCFTQRSLTLSWCANLSVTLHDEDFIIFS